MHTSLNKNFLLCIPLVVHTCLNIIVVVLVDDYSSCSGISIFESILIVVYTI